MDDSVTIEECDQPIIKIGTVVAAVLSVTGFIIFWEISNPFWISIFRFGSFVFFAITVLGYLRLMNKPMTIIMKYADEQLKILYHKKGEMVQEEGFDPTKIKEVRPVSPGNYLLSSLLQPNSRTFEIHFSDTKKKLYLFEFGGRPLFFDTDATQKVTDFLQKKNI